MSRGGQINNNGSSGRSMSGGSPSRSFSGGSGSPSVGRGGGSNYRPSPTPRPSYSSPRPTYTSYDRYDRYGRNRYDRYDRYTSRPRRSNKFTDFLAFIFVIAVIMFIWFGSKGEFQYIKQITSNNITNEVQREKLDSSALVKSNNWIDDSAKWLSNSGKVENAMKYFLDKTGVQPYLMIYDNINGSKTFNDSDVEKLLTNTYDKLFKDEAHTILFFIEPTENNYKRYLYSGTSASTVMDSNAQNIMYKYIDSYYVSDMTDDEYFSTIFTKTADTIMKKVTTKNDVAKSNNYKMIIFILVAGGIIFFVIKKKTSIKEKELAKDILNSDIEKPKDSTIEDIEKKYQ